MRTLLILSLFACVMVPVFAQQNGFPTDGNKLLDACSVMVGAADNPTSISSLSGNAFTEKMSQLSWCAGYLGGIHDILIQNEVSLVLMGVMDMKLTGTDKQKAWAVDALQVACIPEKAPILQLARIIVKWLREHPERLHESKGILTSAALKDAFPCQQPTPKEAAKPTAAKP